MPAPSSDQSAAIDDLVDVLRRFTVESEAFVEAFARAHGLGRSDLNAIMWISAGMRSGRPVTVGELAAKLGVGPPAVTALVDRLEKAGYVRRARDARDRRKVTIETQPPAEQLAMESSTPLGRPIHDALTGTPPDDMRQTTAVVRRLIAAVTAAREAVARPGPS